MINRLDKTPNIIAKFPQNCSVVIKKISPENAFLDILSEGAMALVLINRHDGNYSFIGVRGLYTIIKWFTNNH